MHIDDLNAVLFQTVKYLSMMRIRGRPVPRNILLASLNARKAYLYDSGDYLDSIEGVYAGSASRENCGFTCGKPVREFDYSDAVGEEAMVAALRTNRFAKTPVVGAKERNTGKAHAVVANKNEEGKSITGKQLFSVLKKVCKDNAVVMTDQYTGYNILDKEK